MMIQDFDVLKEEQEHSSISAAPVISYLLSNHHTESWADTLCFHQEAPQAPRYQGAKVKPCDCNVIAQQVHLPVLHHYSAFIGKMASPLRMTPDFPTETLSIQWLHVNISKFVMNWEMECPLMCWEDSHKTLQYIYRTTAAKWNIHR